MTAWAEGPYFDELEIGQVFDTAPSITLSAGLVAAHRGILGDRFRLALDEGLATAVAGAPLAPPSLVWNAAIGQSTLATHHVKANLFYRRLALLRHPTVGDALTTVTCVVGLRENARKEGRAPTGLAALHMTTVDQQGRTVLDFYRCAMLPLRGEAPTGRDDDLSAIGADRPEIGVTDLIPPWDIDAWRRAVGETAPPPAGIKGLIIGGDVVTSAPELARLTLNIASAHHDSRVGGGQRLVYGGHTIGLSLGQITRALPNLVTVLSWESCDHLGPVHEGDTLRTELEVERVRVEGAWSVLDLRARVAADSPDGPREVLDWRFAALLA